MTTPQRVRYGWADLVEQPMLQTLAVRYDDIRSIVGSRPFVALPREEVERLYASIEVVSVADASGFVPLVTLSVVHHNYRWLVFDGPPRSIAITEHCRASTAPLFLDEHFEAMARHAVSAALPPTHIDLRIAALMPRLDSAENRELAIVYAAKLKQPLQLSTAASVGNSDLEQLRRELDHRSQTIIANIAAL